MAEEKSPIVRLKEFFGLSSTEFIREWKELTPEDQSDLKKGIEDGSFNY